jgi:hypothetical protein
MTNQQQHPITPPPELVQLWFEQHYAYNKGLNEILIEAAQWGADQELEACITWLDEMQLAGSGDIEVLRAARRPKPPSLKEQALALIDDCTDPEGDYLDDNALSIIRRALEALPND